MAKISVPFLVEKRTRSGATHYYWQPSATLKKDGWTALRLGTDRRAAIAAAETRNEEVTRRKLGQAAASATPAATVVTVDALIDRFRKEHMPSLAETTRHTYGTALNIIAAWGKDFPLKVIDSERVAVLRDALMSPHPETGEIRHHRAHNTLRVMRTLFEFAIKKRILPKGANPAEDFELSTPDPRFQIWKTEDDAAFDRGAAAIGYPSLGLARELTQWLGQREADMISLTSAHWAEISGMEFEDEELHRELAAASHDGRVMGFKIRQKKGSRKNINSPLVRRWVAVPVVGALRARVETAIAANARADVATTAILANDYSGQPWTLRQFQRKFAEACAWAVSPPTEQHKLAKAASGVGVDPHPALAELQFRDLRRTAVVRLGQLGLGTPTIVAITGHTLKSAEKILEVYCPRTTPMAGRAVVARLRHERRAEARRASGGQG